jgi:hypothetical protein
MIAVDPGEQGAVARWTAAGLLWVLPLDDGFLPAQALAELPGEVLIVELPGFARDKASVSSALAQGRNVGRVEAAGRILAERVILVPAQTWRARVGVQGGTKPQKDAAGRLALARLGVPNAAKMRSGSIDAALMAWAGFRGMIR